MIVVLRHYLQGILDELQVWLVSGDGELFNKYF